MRTRIQSKINKLDPKSYNRKLTRAAKGTGGDPRARRFIINHLRQFYLDLVDTSKYGSAYKLINTTFTLEDFGIREGFANQAQLIAAIRQHPQLAQQIVQGMKTRMRQAYTRAQIDNQKLYKQDPVDIAITMSDIEIDTEFRGGKTVVVFKPTDGFMQRFLGQQFSEARHAHNMQASSTHRAFLNYIRNQITTNPDTGYLKNLISTAREFEGNKVVSLKTIVGGLRQGTNTLELENIPDINDVISDIEWTFLYQQQLDRTMEQWAKITNPAAPPDLKKRSGKLIKSAYVRAHYNRKTLEYGFEDYYLANEDHGYRVRDQMREGLLTVVQRTVSRDIIDKVVRI